MNGFLTKWLLGLIATLLALLVVALWSGNARLAAVEINTANVKEFVLDHEQRVRRLERLVDGRRDREPSL